MKIHVLGKEDVAKALSMKDAIEAMRHCFLRLSENLAMVPLRTTIPIAQMNAASLFMPASIPEDNQLGIKIVSIFPKNSQHHLPTINGAILLLNSQTGEPKAFIEASLLTALRTGAASGLATDLLASPDAKTLAIIGSGAQAKTQLEAVLNVRKITDVIIFSRNNANAQKFVIEMQKHFPSVNMTTAKSISAAVKNVDIICTATNATEPFLFDMDVKDNCHINAIGSHSKDMQEIDLSVIEKAKVIVDQRLAALAEAGEIINAVKKNIITESDLIEIGEIINKVDEQTKLKKQLTIFKSVGLAIQDLSAAEKALDIAIKNNIGSVIDF